MRNVFVRTAAAIVMAGALVVSPTTAFAQSSFGSSYSGWDQIIDEQPPVPENNQPEKVESPKAFRQQLTGPLKLNPEPPQRNEPVYAASNQGDGIYTLRSAHRSTGCTIGYVNKQARALYTAAHCGDDNDVVYNDKWQPIGVLHYVDGNWKSYSNSNNVYDVGGWKQSNNDMAYISLYTDVPLGNNVYSTDRVMPSADVTPGREVCQYGNTSREVKCGRLVDKVDSRLRLDKLTSAAYVVSTADASHGDSGGPMWDRQTGAFIGTTNQSIRSSVNGEFFTGALMWGISNQ